MIFKKMWYMRSYEGEARGHYSLYAEGETLWDSQPSGMP